MKFSLISILCGFCLTTITEIKGSLMHIPGPDIWKLFHLQCGKRCLYGYETDVEGNPFCKCRDPCKNVFCFGGTVCIIKRQKQCNDGYCQLEAYCEDKNKAENLPVDEFGNREATDDFNKQMNSELNLSDKFQKDSNAANVSSEKSGICSDRLPPEARKCAQKSKRYFFSSKRGKCVKYFGCETEGNNFKSRRQCKKTCMSKSYREQKRGSKIFRTNRKTSGNMSNETNVCLTLSEEMTSCSGRKLMRWYFSSQKDRCVRIKVCKQAARNFFRKRGHCRRECQNGYKRNKNYRRRSQSRRNRGNRRKYPKNNFPK